MHGSTELTSANRYQLSHRRGKKPGIRGRSKGRRGKVREIAMSGNTTNLRFSGVQRKANSYVPPGARRTTGPAPPAARASPVASSTAIPTQKINGAAAGLPAKPVTPSTAAATPGLDVNPPSAPNRSVSEAVPSSEKPAQFTADSAAAQQPDADRPAVSAGVEDKVSLLASCFARRSQSVSAGTHRCRSVPTICRHRARKGRSKETVDDQVGQGKDFGRL